MKSLNWDKNYVLYTVAPLVGAWIEISKMIQPPWNSKVAPLVGAWIEIDEVSKLRDVLQRRSPCGSVD